MTRFLQRASHKLSQDKGNDTTKDKTDYTKNVDKTEIKIQQFTVYCNGVHHTQMHVTNLFNRITNATLPS